MLKLKNIIKFSIILISLGLISSVEALANVSTPGYYINTYNAGSGRSTGYYYVQTASGKMPVYKLKTTNSTGSSDYSGYNTMVYSLSNGVGFGARGSADYSVKNYNQYFDFTDTTSIQSPYSDALSFRTNSSNYAKVMWILENMANVNDSSSVNQLLSNAGMNMSDFNTYSIPGKNSTAVRSDIIEIVQQAAIWYYTNPSGTSYHTATNNDGKTNFYYAPSSGNSANDLSGYDTNNSDPANKLFKYLIEKANSEVINGSYNVTKTQSLAPLRLNKNDARVETRDDKYLIGPYKIEKNNYTNYSFEAKVLSGTNEISNATILAADGRTALEGATTSIKLSQNIGKQFYISVPLNTSASDITIEINQAYTAKTYNYWSVPATSIRNSTPVILVRTQSVNLVDKDTKEIAKPNFDLAIRQFVTSVNGENVEESREPKITNEEINKLVSGDASLDGGTTAEKKHSKNPVLVKNNDRVVLDIRIYNEGNIAGTAQSIVEHLPSGVSLAPNSEINNQYGWSTPANAQTAVTEYTRNRSAQGIKQNSNLNFILVKIELLITEQTKSSDVFMKCVCEIQSSQKDRDSNPGNLTDDQMRNYNPGTNDRGKGYQDDDDFENLVIPGRYFDLSLRTFVSQVDTVDYNREPMVSVNPLLTGKTTAEYKQTKGSVSVGPGSTVIYTIRVYNEGTIDGYAKEITAHLPAELEFINDEFNGENGWILDANDTTQRTLRSTKLSKDNDAENVIKAYDLKASNLNYKEIKLRCKVRTTAEALKKITNIVEITKYENNERLADRDNQSTVVLPSDEQLSSYKGHDSNKDDLADPNYFYQGQEDDDDFEKVVLEKFDLALRQFVSSINGTTTTDREPIVDITKFGTVDTNGNAITTCSYNQRKDVLQVYTGDIVTFTIRVYNEGTQKGYAKTIKDSIPSGLEFLPNDTSNEKYKWKMYDSAGQETEDASQAVSLQSGYLSKDEEVGVDDRAITPFDHLQNKTPAYREITITFKVAEPHGQRDVTNKVEISNDSDESGHDVTDIDSTPDAWNEGEDDQDEETIHVKFFDFKLRNIITKTILIEEGHQTDQMTGIDASSNVKSAINIEMNNEKVENTVIKIQYEIIVRNEGEIPGYATEIVDYVPDGLRFSQADNSAWRVSGDRIVSNKLKDKLIEPGKEEKLDLILTWVNSDLNFKSMVNAAEIGDFKNDHNTPDINSTPNNKAKGENDYDEAMVNMNGFALTMAIYIMLGIAGLLAVVVGAVLVKKHLKK